MSEWKEIQLSEVIEFKNGFAFKSNDFIASGIPVIKIKNVKPNNILLDNLSYVSEDVAKGKESYLIQPDDILMTMSGNRSDGSPDSWVGKVALFKKKGTFLLNQRVSMIRVNEKKASVPFIAYNLSSWQTQVYLINQANSSGGQANISPDIVKKMEILLPPLEEQIQIASILSSLDDKIDLLHRQNKTLEALAETLFRQWFVEGVEKSWEVGKLGDVISVKGGTTPSTTKPEFWNGNIHWTSPRDLSNNNSIFLFNTERKITEKGLEQIGSGLLPIGTVLLSSRAPIGYLVITEIPVAINQGYIAIICDKLVSNYFIYLWIKRNLDTIISAANGSVFLEISKSTFKELDFTIPPKEKLKLFDKEIEPLFQKIKSNTKQILTLTRLRDSLLPKLMSGEVRVSADMEAVV